MAFGLEYAKEWYRYQSTVQYWWKAPRSKENVACLEQFCINSFYFWTKFWSKIRLINRVWGINFAHNIDYCLVGLIQLLIMEHVTWPYVMLCIATLGKNWNVIWQRETVTCASIICWEICNMSFSMGLIFSTHAKVKCNFSFHNLMDGICNISFFSLAVNL